MENDELSRVFVKWPLLDWWEPLLQAYKEMGFTDDLSDTAKIEEFTMITDLMNKWITKAEKVVVPYWPFNKDDGITAFMAMTERLVVNTRVKLVYTRLRDNWNEITLAKLNNMLINEAKQWAEEEEEGEDDGRREHYEF